MIALMGWWDIVVVNVIRWFETKLSVVLLLMAVNDDDDNEDGKEKCVEVYIYLFALFWSIKHRASCSTAPFIIRLEHFAMPAVPVISVIRTMICKPKATHVITIIHFPRPNRVNGGEQEAERNRKHARRHLTVSNLLRTVVLCINQPASHMVLCSLHLCPISWRRAPSAGLADN